MKDSLKILKIQSTPKKDPRFKEKDSQQVEMIFELKAATESHGLGNEVKNSQQRNERNTKRKKERLRPGKYNGQNDEKFPRKAQQQNGHGRRRAGHLGNKPTERVQSEKCREGERIKWGTWTTPPNWSRQNL